MPIGSGSLLPARSMGEPSAELKPQGPDLLQPQALSRIQPDRTVLQQDQAMVACRDPVRQARNRLSGARQTRIDPDLATRE
jgi:hypothetical protein